MKTNVPFLHPQHISHFGLGPARRLGRHQGSRSLRTSERHQAASDDPHQTLNDANCAQNHANSHVLTASDGNGDAVDGVATAFRWPGAFGSHAVSILGM